MTRARLLYTIGQVYVQLGLYEEADVDRATSLQHVADLLWYQGRYDLARDELDRGVENREAALGEENPRLADALVALGRVRIAQKRSAESEATLKRVVDIREKRSVFSPAPMATALVRLEEAKQGRDWALRPRRSGTRTGECPGSERSRSTRVSRRLRRAGKSPLSSADRLLNSGSAEWPRLVRRSRSSPRYPAEGGRRPSLG
jgi:hypothetical protein